MIHILYSYALTSVNTQFSKEAINKKDETLVQIEYRYPTGSCTSTPTTYNSFYQQYLLKADELSKNIVKGTTFSFAETIKTLYKTDSDTYKCLPYVQARLLIPISLKYKYESKAGASCATGTSSNITIDSTLTAGKTAVSSEWIYIFMLKQENGVDTAEAYQIPYMTFIVNLTNGTFKMNEINCVTLTANKPTIIQSKLVYLDTRATCAENYIKGTSCVKQGDQTSVSKSLVGIQLKNSTTATGQYVFQDVPLFIGWTGTDGKQVTLTSERTVFSHFQQFIIPQSFYDTLTKWGNTIA
ncbi:Hypothetical_protein [Hexamita inflata]|uniref:Hypothetical_protein n=1 Tax=Hexamita inflata TaxID=28002 RepID=A0AA86TSU5_9EUKA|nr:Hypothetical protein HINF_LOCUS15299 [Hexamita inflata]